MITIAFVARLWKFHYWAIFSLKQILGKALHTISLFGTLSSKYFTWYLTFLGFIATTTYVLSFPIATKKVQMEIYYLLSHLIKRDPYIQKDERLGAKWTIAGEKDSTITYQQCHKVGISVRKFYTSSIISFWLYCNSFEKIGGT